MRCEPGWPRSAGETLVGAEQPAGAAYSADGRYLAIGSQTGQLRLLDLQADDPLAQPVFARPRGSGRRDWLQPRSALPSQRQLRWNCAAVGSPRRRPCRRADGSARPHPQVLALAWSPNRPLPCHRQCRQCGAAMGYDQDRRRSDPARRPHRQRGGDRMGPDGRYLASGGLDGTARLWDTQAADLPPLHRCCTAMTRSSRRWPGSRQPLPGHWRRRTRSLRSGYGISTS